MRPEASKGPIATRRLLIFFVPSFKLYIYSNRSLGKNISMAARSKKLDLDARRKKQSAEQSSDLKGLIIQFCKDRGADLIGFAPVERWDEAGEVPPDFRPQAIWPPARTVIAMGMEMPLPIVETT